MDTASHESGNNSSNGHHTGWTSWFTGSSSNTTSNGDASLSESILKRSFLAGKFEGNNGSSSHQSGASVVSHASSSSSSKSRMSGESTEEEEGRGRNVHGDEQELPDVDEDSLMWEAQMALISHEYKSAMRKLKRAVRHGSAAACLSLGNILVKGLSCKDHSDHYTIHANPTEAAEYYILGLEYLYQRDQQARQESQDPQYDEEEEDHTPLLGSEDMETLQDLSTGLCSLYRLGRLRPVSEDSATPLLPSSSPTSELKGKHKEKAGYLDEKQGLSAESDRRLTLWDRGGTVSQSLIPRIQPLLGYPNLQEPSSPSCETPRPQSASRTPSSESISSTNTTKLKKQVSFTRLPPKHKSALDPIATRQARVCLIHLYYISALVTFATHTHEGKNDARKAWARILYINESSRGNGGGSKEADELVQKAKIRLEMLKDPAQARETIASHMNGTIVNGNEKHHQPAIALKLGKLDIPDEAKDLTIQHMLSPPVTAAEHPSPLDGFMFVPVNEKPRMEKPRLHGIRPKGSSRTSSARSTSQQSQKDDTFLPSVHDGDGKNGLEPPAYSRNHSSTSAASSSRKTKPKFSISDSPTSTIRSYTSVKGNRSRANSNASVLSGVVGGVTKSRVTSAGGLEAPWLLRRPSSSTSLSLLPPDLPVPKEAKQASTNADSKSKAHKPVLIGKSTPSKSKWAPKIRTATVSTTTSDIPLLSPLSAVDLRKNSTSVASLPHLSTRFDTSKRSQSVSHLLFHRSNGRNGSATSLSSLGMGIQKSFSSLRNFFLPAQETQTNHAHDLSTVPSDDEDQENGSEHDEEEGTAANRIASDTPPHEHENDLSLVKEKLQKAAERHDQALAEYQYWEAGEEESEPADSWNSPIQHTLPLLGEEEEERPSLPEDALSQEQPDSTTPPRSIAADNHPPSSSSKYSFPLPRSLPSDRMVPTMAHLQPQAPPGTPVTPARRARRADKRAFGSVDLTTAPRPSSSGSSPATPPELDENGEIPGPLKIDPLLAALEAASKVNVKTRCAVCAKAGVNFPKARDGRTYCSRECRMSAREEAR